MQEQEDAFVKLVHEAAMRRDLDTYIDPLSGYIVFTEKALLAVGACCESNCRHCPYKTNLIIKLFD